MPLERNGQVGSAMGKRARRVAGRLSLILLAQMAWAPPSLAVVTGMVMDNENGRAIVFDAETGLVTAFVPIGPNFRGTGDCLVLGDRGPAFATDFDSRVWAFDLESSPPRLATPPNPIRISNPGEDLAISADHRFLVVCDGSGPAPVSVIDLATRREVAAFDLGSDCDAVDVCDDGSVLVSSITRQTIRRLTLGPDGSLTDTGESVAVIAPMNVDCAPGSGSGVVANFFPAGLQSFTIPGLAAVDTRPIEDEDNIAQSVLIHPAGNRVYARAGHSLVAYDFDPSTGHIGPAPAFRAPNRSLGGFFGMEQIALDPAGERLYVPQSYPAEIEIRSASTGDLLGSIALPEFSQPTGVCLATEVDGDDDGLSDAREAALGTDADNPDSDGDGLLDGFEVRFGLQPLNGADGGQDADADGLDNLGEQAARTDPTVADSDGDGLSDGQEVLVWSTDPVNPDSDGDRLQDGAEVSPHGSDPRNPDTDGGGVRDGVEVARDDTNPTDPADDRPVGRAMLMDADQAQAVIFDRDTEAVVGVVQELYGQAVGDCHILEDGSQAFATTFSWEIHAINLTVTPPVLAPPPNPIPIDNPGEDLAPTVDGRYLVVCDGSSIDPVVVVEVATRTQVDALDLGTDCTSVDVCADGSVLVTSATTGVVRRLEIDAAGHLTDVGVRFNADRPSNITCAPDGRSGIVLSGLPSPAIISFTVPGLAVVDRRDTPAAPVALAFAPDGDRVFVRRATNDTGSIEAYGYDRHTGHLDPQPEWTAPVSGARRFFGIDTITVDPSGTELHVTEFGALSILDTGSGRVLSSILDAAIENPTGVCLRQPDRDHDGLTDDLERRLGTDPDDPDSDGDGVPDGYESHHDQDPLSPGDGTTDPDGDGLDNGAEAAARTDPANPDTDHDGLSDGEEVLTYATDPRDGDMDGDHLADGEEVHARGTDPRNPDSDGGGALDGNEVALDASDPLDPADDLAAGRVLFTNYYNGYRATVVDQETSVVLAALTQPTSSGYDCVIPPDGGEGFIPIVNGLRVVDLESTPPAFAASPNPIPTSIYANDVAASPDGKYIVSCSTTGFMTSHGISVVDREARVEVGVSNLVPSCRAIDVCPDGSVLVVSSDGSRITRLMLGDDGALTDPQEFVEGGLPTTQWTNVTCAPAGEYVLALRSDQTLRSLRLRGLEPVDVLALPGGASDPVMQITGLRATIFMKLGGPVRIAAYTIDLATGRFDADPLFVRTIFNIDGYGTLTAEALALDRRGELLYVLHQGVLKIYGTHDGSFQGTIAGAESGQVFAVCAARAGDSDGDGLADDEESRLGTDRRSADTDGDGLLDGFEARNGLDPRSPGDAHDDPDADGLDNLGEQGAGTLPRVPDTDADGLNDGQEVLVAGTDPLDPDTDDDGVLDGADPCPREVPNDPDGDGVCQSVDICPGVPDTAQTDTDADGWGDACDLCPRVSDPAQAESVACFAPITGGGACLQTTIDMVRAPGESGAIDGAILIHHVGGTPPDAIEFTVLDTACTTGDVFEFELNGVPVGRIEADPTLSCDCQAPQQSFRFEDAAVLAGAWLPSRDNVLRIRKIGNQSGLAWIRLTAWRGVVATETCVFDHGGGDCDVTDLCAAGYVIEGFETTHTFLDPFLAAGAPVVEAPFLGGALPGTIDLAGIAAGDYLLCARSDVSLPHRMACVPMTLQGQARLILDGAGCGAGPTAAIRGGGASECSSPDGATVLLDGTASIDPDDDIVLYEWFEDYGEASERLVAAGAMTSVTLALGAHAITLKVTDSGGLTGLAAAPFTVVDTTAPVLSVGLAPALLWPPAHQMVQVNATVGAVDLCGAASFVLTSLQSSEPDDLAGGADGQTVNDVQDALPGTADVAFRLRAERRSDSPGRTYSATYQARDASGNVTQVVTVVLVPHDRHGAVDPIDLRAGVNPGGTVLTWSDAAGLERYDVVRGDLHRVRELPDVIDLGPLICIESRSADRSTAGNEDADVPAVGEGFFYLIEYDDGVIRTLGSDTTAKPRLPGAGGTGC